MGVGYLWVGDEDHAMGGCARGLDLYFSIAIEDDEDEGKSYPLLPIIPEAVLDRCFEHSPLSPPHHQHAHNPDQIANAQSVFHVPALSSSSSALIGSPVFVHAAVVAATERRQGTLEDGEFWVCHVRGVGVRPMTI